jgi:shikimate kinase
MGSGKTSTGKDLAKLLQFRFFDTDHWIEEKNKKNIARIFKENGENFFRSEEKKVISWIQNHDRSVISLGGGLWIDEANRNQLLSLGWCVWLRVSAETAWNRVKMNLEQRPLLSQAKDPLAEIKRMMEKRDPIYQSAHSSFLTDDKTPNK